MYMSRVKLDTNRRSTMQAIASPQIFHGAVENSTGYGELRNLWRIDSFGEHKHLLLVTATVPDLSRISSQFGFQDEATSKTLSYGAFLERIENGQKWMFRLTANPVCSVPTGGKASGERGKIYAQVTAEQQKLWLMKRSSTHGFQLIEQDFEVSNSQWMKFTKGMDRKNDIILHSVSFAGSLTVTDGDKFRDVLINGIGRAKAYGCGLLTVMQIRKDADV